MNKNIFLLMFLMVLTITTVSASTYKIGSAFELTTSCDDFTCADVNTTIFFPNGTIFKDNQEMTSNIYYANISITPTTQGDYITYFSDGVNITTSSFSATSTGFELTQPRAIIFIGFLFILVFLFVVTIIGIPIIPSGDNRNEKGELISINNLKHLRGILYVIAYLLLMGISYLSSNVALAYLGTTLFGKTLFIIFQILFLIALPMFFVWLMFILTRIFNDKETKKMIERGVYEGGI